VSKPTGIEPRQEKFAVQRAILQSGYVAASGASQFGAEKSDLNGAARGQNEQRNLPKILP